MRIPYERMAEIATVALHALNECADGWNNVVYDTDVQDLDLTEEEMEYFGIYMDEEDDEYDI